MADKINWLPAALGAALGAGIILVRLPDADRRITAAAALTGAALGYGVADYIEDRRNMLQNLIALPGNVAGSLFDLSKQAGGTVASTASNAASKAASTTKKAGQAVAKAIGGLKFW